MDYFYLSHGFSIYPHRHAIEQQGTITHIRPKTFALLLALLKQPREIITKDFLLTTIWDDVAVDEQVLVQSIRELRQLFGSADVIKTYPRKGYAWVPEVQLHSVETGNLVNVDKSEPPAPAKKILQPYKLQPYKYWIGIVAIFVVIAFFAFNSGFNGFHASTSMNGTLMVLPVKTRIADKDQQRIYLGAMDQLIHLLASDSVVVMDTVYVLNAMRHADMPRDYTSAQVQRIFEVSGAGLVVESELSGSVGEYRLDYKLHVKNDIKPGAVFGQELNDVLSQLAKIISPYTGKNGSIAVSNHQSEFNNELMARALEYMDQGANDKARDILISVISMGQHNVVASQLLAQVHIQNHEPVLAEQVLVAAIGRQQDQTKEVIRLHYWLAVAQLQQGQLEKALSSLDGVDPLINDHGDWLYRAYIAELRGQIFNQRHQTQKAETALKEALKYHRVIQCPIGEAQIQLQLADLLKQQGRRSEAIGYLSQAKRLIETHRLDFLRLSLEEHLIKPVLTN